MDPASFALWSVDWKPMLWLFLALIVIYVLYKLFAVIDMSMTWANNLVAPATSFAGWCFSAVPKTWRGVRKKWTAKSRAKKKAAALAKRNANISAALSAVAIFLLALNVLSWSWLSAIVTGLIPGWLVHLWWLQPKPYSPEMGTSAVVEAFQPGTNPAERHHGAQEADDEYALCAMIVSHHQVEVTEEVQKLHHHKRDTQVALAQAFHTQEQISDRQLQSLNSKDRFKLEISKLQDLAKQLCKQLGMLCICMSYA